MLDRDRWLHGRMRRRLHPPLYLAGGQRLHVVIGMLRRVWHNIP